MPVDTMGLFARASGKNYWVKLAHSLRTNCAAIACLADGWLRGVGGHLSFVWIKTKYTGTSIWNTHSHTHIFRQRVKLWRSCCRCCHSREMFVLWDAECGRACNVCLCLQVFWPNHVWMCLKTKIRNIYRRTKYWNSDIFSLRKEMERDGRYKCVSVQGFN